MLYDKSVTAYTLLILMLSKRKICDVDNMITVKYTHFRGEKTFLQTVTSFANPVMVLVLMGWIHNVGDSQDFLGIWERFRM